MDMSTNVFLDLGSHRFEGLRQFADSILPIDGTWEIHAFEPNPLIDLKEMARTPPHDKFNITTYNRAVWTDAGTHVFKLYGNDGLSQGGLLEKANESPYYGDYHSSATVECIDLHDFILKLKDRDNLYVKMDVEWAEYTILPNMLERGWPSNIRRMWVEFHGQDYKEWSDKCKYLMDRITNQTNTVIEKWI